MDEVRPAIWNPKTSAAPVPVAMAAAAEQARRDLLKQRPARRTTASALCGRRLLLYRSSDERVLNIFDTLRGRWFELETSLEQLGAAATTKWVRSVQMSWRALALWDGPASSLVIADFAPRDYDSAL